VVGGVHEVKVGPQRAERLGAGAVRVCLDDQGVLRLGVKADAADDCRVGDLGAVLLFLMEVSRRSRRNARPRPSSRPSTTPRAKLVVFLGLTGAAGTVGELTTVTLTRLD
jgi:hypothetical protein